MGGGTLRRTDWEAGAVEVSRVELESHDGEDEDGEQHEHRDLQQRCHRADDRFEHHLQTCRYTQNPQWWLMIIEAVYI